MIKIINYFLLLVIFIKSNTIAVESLLTNEKHIFQITGLDSLDQQITQIKTKHSYNIPNKISVTEIEQKFLKETLFLQQLFQQIILMEKIKYKQILFPIFEFDKKSIVKSKFNKKLIYKVEKRKKRMKKLKRKNSKNEKCEDIQVLNNIYFLSIMNLYVKKQYKENKFLSSYYSIFNKYKTNNEYFHEIFKFGQYNLKYIKYKHIEISLQINFNDYFLNRMKKNLKNIDDDRFYTNIKYIINFFTIKYNHIVKTIKKIINNNMGTIQTLQRKFLLNLFFIQDYFRPFSPSFIKDIKRNNTIQDDLYKKIVRMFFVIKKDDDILNINEKHFHEENIKLYDENVILSIDDFCNIDPNFIYKYKLISTIKITAKLIYDIQNNLKDLKQIIDKKKGYDQAKEIFNIFYGKVSKTIEILQKYNNHQMKKLEEEKKEFLFVIDEIQLEVNDENPHEIVTMDKEINEIINTESQFNLKEIETELELLI